MTLLQSLQNIPILDLILAISIAIITPIAMRYLWRHFEISELTLSPPWFKLIRKTTIIPKFQHNLPQPDYGRFIGRENELSQISRILRPYPYSQHSIITIDGIGGVGKSALALEVAHRVLRDSVLHTSKECFDAIIWVSAKQAVLTVKGIITRKQAFRTLHDIYSAIAITLEHNDLNLRKPEEKPELVRNLLSQQRVLLIIDNLETIDDDEVINFLIELPAPTKSIITTRHRIDVAYPIRLKGMGWKDAQTLIIEECKKKAVRLKDEELRRLYERTGGVPLAIVWSIAQVGLGYTPETVLNRLSQPTGDIARFCFGKVLELIKANSSYKLLAAIAMFDEGTTREKLGTITAMPELDRDDGLVELEKLSLINREDGIFTMLPLTRDYVKAELDKDTALKSFLKNNSEILLFRDIASSIQGKSSSAIELRIPVGVSSNDMNTFELVIRTSIPNVLIAGNSGSGKTNLIQVIVAGLTRKYSPTELGLIFMESPYLHRNLFSNLPHTIAIQDTVNNFEHLVQKLESECITRNQLFEDHRVKDIDEFCKLTAKPLPRLVVIADECYQLNSNVDSYKELERFVQWIKYGRSLGISLILATQDVKKIDSQIKNIISQKFVFRCSHEEAHHILNNDWERAVQLNIGESLYQGYRETQFVTQLVRIAHFNPFSDFYSGMGNYENKTG